MEVQENVLRASVKVATKQEDVHAENESFQLEFTMNMQVGCLGNVKTHSASSTVLQQILGVISTSETAECFHRAAQQGGKADWSNLKQGRGYVNKENLFCSRISLRVCKHYGLTC